MQNLLDVWKKLTNGSINRKIFGVAVIIAIMTALTKVMSITKELAVAWKFGTDDALDAFLIALLLPSFIINVVASSFNSALIPTYIQVREQEGAKAAQRLFSGATVWSIGLLGVVTLLIVVTAPICLPWIASGFSPEKLHLTFLLLCSIAPAILLNGIAAIWGAVINAAERFVLVAISPAITPAATILFLLFAKSWGIFSLAAGLVCGALLEMILLGVVLYLQGVSLLPKWQGFDAHLRQAVNQYVPMIAGASLMCSAVIVDQSMAAMLSSGSVAALNYGNRVITLILGISTTALGTALIPYFSRMIAIKDWVGVHHTFKSYIRLIFLIAVPLTGIIVLFSNPIVWLLFQRGSFTLDDTRLVGQIQVFYALQIPFYLANILVVKLISALKSTHILMYGAAINLGANILLNYLFMHVMGIAGIALSTSCVYVISFAFLLHYWLRFSRRECNI